MSEFMAGVCMSGLGLLVPLYILGYAHGRSTFVAVNQQNAIWIDPNTALLSASLITFPSVSRRRWYWWHMRYEVWVGYSWIALSADGQPRAYGWIWEKPERATQC